MKNLLFISIEDLNDYVEPLGGHPDAITPNISRLARSGMLFSRAFASAPACSPSRTAVLFGKWPWDTGIYTNQQNWHSRFKPDHDLSLIGHLRNAGFETHGAGKMFYGGIAESEWTSYFKTPGDPNMRQSVLQKTFNMAAEMLDYGPSLLEGPLYDERTTEHILGLMSPGARGKVWSLGIYRPHLPFVAPRRFFDLYPEKVAAAPALRTRDFDPYSDIETRGLPPAARRRVVKNADFAKRLHQCGEYNAFLRAYLASVTYADHLLGRVLDRLEETGLADNTYIVLWSDHGYHFGERNVFHKFTLWERSLRSPLIFAGPGIAQGEHKEPVSNVDLGKTVSSLMEIQTPESWAGTNLLPVLHGAARADHPPVVSVYGFKRTDVKAAAIQHAPLMLAWSVRTAEWRLIRYWNQGFELYSHKQDPLEHNNLVPGGHIDRLDGHLADVVRTLAEAIPAKKAQAARPTRHNRVSRSDGDQQFPHWSRFVRWRNE